MNTIWPPGHPLHALLYGQSDLEQLCSERPLDWDEYAHMNEFHGNASVLKRFAGLPQDEPLPFAVEHAIPYDLETAYAYDLNCGLPLFLAVHGQSAALYREGPIEKVEPVGFTYLYAMDLFSRLHPEVGTPERRGTLVFPDKSTLLMDTDFDRDAFAARLAALPEAYQPVVVCVYWRDVVRGNHAAYVKAGLPIVSCGHLRDPDFLLRLHDLCRRFRWSCANDIAGSYVLSILSGCHFFHLPSGPVTQSKHGQTGTFQRDPTLEKPEKTACLEAAPFPPGDPGPQQTLAHRLAGVDYKKTAKEICALWKEGHERLVHRLQPISLEIGPHTPLDAWHALRPVGVDRDGWMRRDARLRIGRTESVAGARLTFEFLKPAAPDDQAVELVVQRQGLLYASLKPPRYRQELVVACEVDASETVIGLSCSHDVQLPGEPRRRCMRLTRVELLDAPGLSTAMQPTKKAGQSKAATRKPESGPSLLRRLRDRLFTGRP